MRLRPEAGQQEHGPCLTGVSKVERNKVCEQDRYVMLSDATNEGTKVEISLLLIKRAKIRGKRVILSPAKLNDKEANEAAINGCQGLGALGNFATSLPPAQQVSPCRQKTEDKGVKSSW